MTILKLLQIGTRESSNTALPFPSRFWTAAPMTDRNLNPNSTTWLVSIQDLTDSGDDKLLNWTGLSGICESAVRSTNHCEGFQLDDENNLLGVMVI